MKDVYTECPVFESTRFLLRPVKETDAEKLLSVYSDRRAVPLFNSDNCHGDDFYYSAIERMKQAVVFWEDSCRSRCFVRWIIIDKTNGRAAGTIELFHRDSDDFFTDCGLLRLDLGSPYETQKTVAEVVNLILEPAYELFSCSMIATKAVPGAVERRKALEEAGFRGTEHHLRGQDGTEYGSYYYRTEEV
ncbi:MAG: GNAT family N-acetyltransferase [Treponema sp.]|jgi:RimJ/RimL family protein N-acetyltransferase|nr:GNAT family N-acetyltransferase [Treponema sp.]